MWEALPIESGRMENVLPNSLEARALYFFFENGNPIMNYEDRTYIMKSEYDLPPWKAKVKAEILLLCLTISMCEK